MKLFYLIILFFVCSATSAERPADWASPVKSQELENFYKVDNKLYRSAQPDDDAFEELERLGFKTVLNLREYHSDDDEAEETTLVLKRVRIDTGEISYAEIVKALKIINEADGPVLVHCWHGADRTGAVVAAYRILFHKWTPEKAINELKKGGYNYHSIYRNIPKLVKNLTTEKLAEDVFGKK